MSLQPSKYKVFTKQVHNHLIDEYGDDNMNVGVIMNHINNDELLKLLLKNVKRIQKVEIAFMVYFFSQTNDLESSFSKVRGNLINIGMYQYKDLGYRDITCHECQGSGTEYCSTCDGSGDSGWIDDNVDSEKESKVSTPQLENIAYEALEMFHAGWEINEGSSGSMTFNFENQTFIIDHYTNIEEEVEDFYKSFSFE